MVKKIAFNNVVHTSHQVNGPSLLRLFFEFDADLNSKTETD